MSIDLAELEAKISTGIYGDDRMPWSTIEAATTALSQLVAEVERLWCRVDDLERAREFVRMKASLHERAAVVEYLRAPGTSCDPNVLADAFERGEHLEKT